MKYTSVNKKVQSQILRKMQENAHRGVGWVNRDWNDNAAGVDGRVRRERVDDLSVGPLGLGTGRDGDGGDSWAAVG